MLKPHRIREFKGTFFSSTPEDLPDEYDTGSQNVALSKEDILTSRNGYKAGVENGGGYGLFSYINIDVDDGSTSQEMLTASNILQRASATTFTVTYSGSGLATITMAAADDSSEYEFTVVEDGTEVLSYGVGTGIDEGSPVTLSTLDSQVDAISSGNFAATISGTSTLSAALIPVMDARELTPSNPSLVITIYEWEDVNSTVTYPFAGSETNKNDSAFNIISAVNINGLLYLTNSYDNVQKYDGQTVYNAGLPKISRPTLTNTASGGGVSEVTDVVCRAEAAVAQIQDVICVADSSATEVTRVEIRNDGGSQYNGGWIRFYGWDTSNDQIKTVAFYFETIPGSAPPSSTADELVLVSINPSDTKDTIASKFETIVDAHALFSASRSNEVVTVTDASRGDRNNTNHVDFLSGKVVVTTTTEGSWGLHKTYFQLNDEDGSVAVWYDIEGDDIAPDHGLDREIKITTVSYDDSANDVASATSTAVNSDSKFSTSVLTDTVTVTNATAAEVGAPDAGTSGFTVTASTDGLDSLHEKYFILYDDVGEDDGVAFWFDVGGGGTEPSHGAGRAVEITGVSASDSNTTVASVVQAAIDGDSGFGASVSTATVTVTVAATGDVPTPDMGTSDFTYTVTTEGSDAGVGIGTFKYRLTMQQTDAAGNIVTGPPTDFNPSTEADNSITLGSSTDNVQLTISGVQAGSGYNTNCAVVNGNQTDTNAITVLTGHTMKVGDKAYFLDRTGGVNDFTTRNVTAVGSTSVTVDGDDVDINDGDAISNNLKIQVWRTKNGGENPYLVANIPNNSISGSQTFIDGVPDAYLGEEWVEPIETHSAPPKAKYAAKWKNKLVLGGNMEEPNVLYFSATQEDGMTSEYFPGTLTLNVASSLGDTITGIASDDQLLIAFTKHSLHFVTGDIDTGNIRIDTQEGNEVGCVSHHSITRVNNTWMWLAEDGVYALGPDGQPIEASEPINSFFTGDFEASITDGGTIAWQRSVGFNDRQNRRFMLFIPVEYTNSAGNVYTSRSKSVVWTFDYYKKRGHWRKWTALDFSGGICKFGDNIYFSEHRDNSFANAVSHHTYQFNNEPNSYVNYSDMHASIDWQLKSSWHTEGDVDLFKKYAKIKLHSNANSVNTSTYTMDVKTEHDFVEDTFVSEFSLSIASRGVSGASRQPQRLKRTKARGMRFILEHNTVNAAPALTGYTIFMAPAYGEAGKE